MRGTKTTPWLLLRANLRNSHFDVDKRSREKTFNIVVASNRLCKRKDGVIHSERWDNEIKDHQDMKIKEVLDSEAFNCRRIAIVMKIRNSKWFLIIWKTKATNAIRTDCDSSKYEKSINIRRLL